MGETMNPTLSLGLLCLLDAGALAICCEAIFQKRSEVKASDGLLLLILWLFCSISQMSFTVNAGVSAASWRQRAEIVPANSIVEVLFLLLTVLVLNSLFFKGKADGDILNGTMAAVSLYLAVRCLSIALLAVCGALGAWLLWGSRVLTLLVIFLLLWTPFFEQLQQFIQTGGGIVWIVTQDAAVLLIAALSVLSFQLEQLLEHLAVVTILLLMLVLVDSILVLWQQRRLQEQKRVQMIEQYVPVVEELISQVRARQHEFQNRMLAIETCVASADTLEEAQREVALLTKGMTISLSERELLACDSKIIAGMLFGKIKQAEAAGVRIDLQLQGLFKQTAAPETEWVELVGILLDNAIEASPKGSTIYVLSRKNGAYMELLVKNPAPAMSNTEFMALFQKGFTTKSSHEGRGFGLYNILRSMERYHGKIVTRNEQIAGENHVVFGVLLP